MLTYFVAWRHTTTKPLLESFLLYHLSVFSEAVSLARLVEAEIVFPLFRDSHQYGRG